MLLKALFTTVCISLFLCAAAYLSIAPYHIDNMNMSQHRLLGVSVIYAILFILSMPYTSNIMLDVLVGKEFNCILHDVECYSPPFSIEHSEYIALLNEYGGTFIQDGKHYFFVADTINVSKLKSNSI